MPRLFHCQEREMHKELFTHSFTLQKNKAEVPCFRILLTYYGYTEPYISNDILAHCPIGSRKPL